MKPQLRKGEMAFIVKCPPQPLNIGLPVTLRKRGSGEWLCEGNVKPGPYGKARPDEVPYHLTWIPAPWLSPIQGDVTDEEVSDLYAPSPSREKEEA